ncbi:MAG: restriction endonuclease [Lewinellaceae bacterium]|nr:restriction endonuclease [Lewinellaceae bacterium]
MKNPPWHRDEIILALDLYFDPTLGPVDKSNPKIIALSEMLNRLPIFNIRPDEEKFRNPNGVTLKLSNFKAIDPEYHGTGMSSFSKLDKEVFETFSKNKALLHQLASDIQLVSNTPELSRAVYIIENDENSVLDCVQEG